MKKLFLAILILALLASLPCLAEEECVYSVDEALSIAAGGGASILRVDCGISWMTTQDAEDLDYGSWKMIVLQRKPGRKEFTALDSGYPGAMTEGFPDDYEGIDISEPEVYLRWDMMRRLPEKNRASSAADADLIVMIEDVYLHSSTITHTEFTGEDVMPDESFTTPEEIAEFYLAHPKYISSITYYPMFADVTLIYLCDPATNQRVTYAYNIVMPVTLARNPQAAALWEEMTAIEQLARMIEEYPAAADADDLQDSFGSSEFVPQFSLNAWCAAAREGRQQDLVNAMRGTYWSLVYDLSDLDGDPAHEHNYNMLVEKRDSENLSLLVEMYNYSGFDQELSEIEEQGLYLAAPDDAWTDNAMAELIILFQ